MSRVLLINPSYKVTYASTMARFGVPFYPVLSLATIIPKVKESGHEVQVIDLCYEDFNLPMIQERIKTWKPDVVGIAARCRGRRLRQRWWARCGNSACVARRAISKRDTTHRQGCIRNRCQRSCSSTAAGS